MLRLYSAPAALSLKLARRLLKLGYTRRFRVAVGGFK
jgi:hypothetical protein